MSLQKLTRRLCAAITAGMVLATGPAVTVPTAAQAAERVDIAIISFSPYAPWYIVQERGLAEDIEINIRIIEDITAKNAAVTNQTVQCMLNTLDSVVVARSADVPIKVIAIPAMSFGLDEMVVTEDIKSVEDFPGHSYGADFAFLNHMWMLLTLKKHNISFDAVNHLIMLPQDSAAAFSSGMLDIDVNYKPFSTQSQRRVGAHVLKNSFTDRTWERGLISEAIACNEAWLAEKPEVAKELLRAWFEAVDWWKQNPQAGNEIVARGLDWPVEDVELTHDGAVMLNLRQNMGALGLEGGKSVCADLPEGTPELPAEPSGWGEILFDGEPDCVAGYLSGTWELFNRIYQEADVIEAPAPAERGIDTSVIEALVADGVHEAYSSNQWIGRKAE